MHFYEKTLQNALKCKYPKINSYFQLICSMRFKNYYVLGHSDYLTFSQIAVPPPKKKLAHFPKNDS